MSPRSRPRPRRFVAPWLLSMLGFLFRYSGGRDAYVLRVIGGRVGPVLRPDRRRQSSGFTGRERRGSRAGVGA